MLEKQVTERHIPNMSSFENKQNKKPQNQKTPNNKQRMHPTKKAINFCTVTAVEIQLTNETEGDVKLNIYSHSFLFIFMSSTSK